MTERRTIRRVARNLIRSGSTVEWDGQDFKSVFTGTNNGATSARLTAVTADDEQLQQGRNRVPSLCERQVDDRGLTLDVR